MGKESARKGTDPSHLRGHEVDLAGHGGYGATFLSLDNTIDLREAKEAVGDRVGLTGNVPPIDVLMDGTPGRVAEAARACIGEAFDTPKGFVLTSGCTVPLDTPPANIRAMVEAARRFGRLPIDPGSLI